VIGYDKDLHRCRASRWAAWVVLGAAVAAAGCGPASESPVRRGRVRVAATSDLNAAFRALITRFGASHDVDVTVTFGSSGALYAQLLDQAPFDMFFSADVGYPNQLASRGLTVPQSEFSYAVGRLVLWTPNASTLDIERQGFQALTMPAVAHVAIANPEDDPYGRAAVAAMRAAGVYEGVRPKLVTGENAAQAMQLVERGAADAGLFALSLASAPGAPDKGRRFEIPAGTYPRIEQGATILRWASDLDAARALRGFVLSADGRAILEQHGFLRPDR